MRSIAVAAIAGVLILAGLQPAAAASKPGSVGMVSFVAASYSRSTGTAGLTVDWRKASRATSYEVFISRSYSMSNAKRFTTRSSSKKITRLRQGANYFVQVRAVNGKRVGTKSTRVGHTTIRRMDKASGPTYRVMTYNLCSDVCSGWSKRQPGVLERIRAYKPDVVAAQEASNLTAPVPGYEQAVYMSAKRLLFKSSRFTVAPSGPVPPKPSVDPVTKCTPSWDGTSTGWVFLGRHDKGCRYAAWAVLIDKKTGDYTVFVDVHTVAGTSTLRDQQRKDEITTLTQFVAAKFSASKIPVVYAGDFNSHKHRAKDSLRSVFHRQGYYDAYDLAMILRQQHYNSFNGFSVKPTISYTWGDHVDHVWIRPNEGRILKWNNGARIDRNRNRMITPIPSDHSPIVVDLRLN